jgi:hypothetical protein
MHVVHLKLKRERERKILVLKFVFENQSERFAVLSLYRGSNAFTHTLFVGPCLACGRFLLVVSFAKCVEVGLILRLQTRQVRR